MSGCRNLFYIALFVMFLGILASLSEKPNNPRLGSAVRVVATSVSDRGAASTSSRGGTSSTHASATRTAQRSNAIEVNRFSSPRERYVHSAVNLRSGPGTSYRQVGSLAAGDSLQAFEQSGDWYLVSHDGRDAYIASWLTHNSPPALRRVARSHNRSSRHIPAIAARHAAQCHLARRLITSLNNCGCRSSAMATMTVYRVKVFAVS